MAQEQQMKAGTSSIKSTFGDWVELTGEGGETVACRIMAELESAGRRYAIVQTEAMRAEGDIEVFRIVMDGNGSPALETVTDDEEWERIAELYDDMQFGNDQRP